jgi:hypothetical protein
MRELRRNNDLDRLRNRRGNPMRVIRLHHEKSGEDIFFKGSATYDALLTLETCLLKQTKKAVADREGVTLSYETMSKADWNALPISSEGSC